MKKIAKNVTRVTILAKKKWKNSKIWHLSEKNTFKEGKPELCKMQPRQPFVDTHPLQHSTKPQEVLGLQTCLKWDQKIDIFGKNAQFSKSIEEIR